MKTMQEYIQDSIAKVSPNATAEEKKSYEHIFDRMIQDNVSLSEAMNLSPDVLEYLYAYGYRLYNSGNYKNAGVIFSFLISLEPEIAKFFMSSGACHHMLKEYAEAIEDYMSAFYLNMTDPLPFYYISDCYIKSNNPDYAIFALGLVIELASQDQKYSKLKERAKLIQEGLRNSENAPQDQRKSKKK